MAPRTCQAQRAVRHPAGGILDGSQVSLEDATGLDISNGTIDVGQDTFAMDDPQNLTGKRKRTSTSHESDPNQAKKTCTVGPVNCRPMQLTLTSEGEAARQPSSDGAEGSNKGKQHAGQPLQRTSSFYPGHGGASSLLDIQPNPTQPQTIQDFDQNSDEPEAEVEEDWIDEQAEKMTALP
ncbi:hypothetical protein EDB89DRAFT_1906742 [Lactarius sanguifluus]|nr:hypothetical protein EDB89DRAFT_1906742 [Lactarius sanguifluus]